MCKVCIVQEDCDECRKGTELGDDVMNCAKEAKKIICPDCGGSGIAKAAFAHCKRCRGKGYWYEEVLIKEKNI